MDNLIDEVLAAWPDEQLGDFDLRGDAFGERALVACRRCRRSMAALRLVDVLEWCRHHLADPRHWAA